MTDELLSAKREKYPVNKGIGRPVEFKGLKAQYLFLFAGGQGIPRAGRDGVLQHVPAKQCPLRGKGVGNGGNLSCKHPARREENKNESGCTEGIRELQHP